MTTPSLRAACFGTVLGWYGCFNLRRETTHVWDIATFAGIIGAASLTKIFPDRPFGYYCCIGLVVGFFASVGAIGYGWLKKG